MAKKSSSTDDMSTKAIVIVALIIAFIGGYLIARAKYKPQIVELTKMVADKDMVLEKMKTDANRLIKKDGVMYIIENGVIREMENEMKMPNGSRVMMDGKVIDSEGNEMMMQNGDAMDLDGNYMPSGGSDVNVSSPTF